jgi:hypothetical protein
MRPHENVGSGVLPREHYVDGESVGSHRRRVRLRCGRK